MHRPGQAQPLQRKVSGHRGFRPSPVAICVKERRLFSPPMLPPSLSAEFPTPENPAMSIGPTGDEDRWSNKDRAVSRWATIRHAPYGTFSAFIR
jgi:hypothetical protein